MKSHAFDRWQRVTRCSQHERQAVLRRYDFASLMVAYKLARRLPLDMNVSHLTPDVMIDVIVEFERTRQLVH
jgi:hypothetical protein